MRHELHEPNRSETSTAHILRALTSTRQRDAVRDMPTARVAADVLSVQRSAPAPTAVPVEMVGVPEVAEAVEAVEVAMPGNNLLRLLQRASRAEHERLLPLLEQTRLERGEVLFEAGGPLPCVYFHETSVTSMVRVLRDGRRIEVGMAGPEGMAGLPAFLGAERSPLQCIVKTAGTAQRLSARALREAARPGGALHGILERYAQYQFDQVAYAAACSSLHGVSERCATWLLMTHDRVRGDQFDLTHGFLATMLGVRRASVSQAAEEFQRAGLIRYCRGRMSVLDREGLEAAACECYASEQANYARIFVDDGPRAMSVGGR